MNYEPNAAPAPAVTGNAPPAPQGTAQRAAAPTDEELLRTINAALVKAGWTPPNTRAPLGPLGEVERKAKLVDDMERIGLYPVNEPSLIEWAEREIRKHDEYMRTPATPRLTSEEKPCS